MARIVYKFPFTSLSQPVQVNCSKQARVVLVDCQGKTPTLWIEDDWDGGLRSTWRNYMAFGTGHPIPDNAVHVGSFQMGSYVWHVYWLKS